MNFKEALDYLETLRLFGIKLGLERMTELARLFDNPQQKFKSIHVAGTNGKGSVSAMISSILVDAGYKTGIYLSPYVFSFGERIQINNVMIEEERFASIVTKVKYAAEIAEMNGFGCMTEFEAKTISAFVYFAEENVDYAVIEVGLGGRFDATNIIKPSISVITNITLDHTQYLGNTVEDIAFEKAGIIKYQTPVVTATNDKKVFEVINEKALVEDSHVIHVCNKSAFSKIYSHFSEDTEITLEYNKKMITGIKPSLFGTFQRENAAAAATTILTILPNIDESHIKNGIAKAVLPGRMQKIHSKPNVIIDGAHNEGAIKAIVASIDEIDYKNLILVIGMLSTHSGDDVLKHIAPLASKIFITKPCNKKAYETSELINIAKKYCNDCEQISDVNDAISCALKNAQENDLILVTGSFYTIAGIDKEKLFGYIERVDIYAERCKIQ